MTHIFVFRDLRFARVCQSLRIKAMYPSNSVYRQRHGGRLHQSLSKFNLMLMIKVLTERESAPIFHSHSPIPRPIQMAIKFLKNSMEIYISELYSVQTIFICLGLYHYKHIICLPIKGTVTIDAIFSTINLIFR